MSLYREAGRRRRRRIGAATGAGLIVLAVVLAVVLAGGSGGPSEADRAAAARAAAQTAADGLELVGIEYPQAVRDGRVVAPTEYEAAQADVRRAAGALAGSVGDVPPARRPVVAQARRAVAAVGRLIARRAPRDEVERARARAARIVAGLAGRDRR
jgi:hypothetical protein